MLSHVRSPVDLLRERLQTMNAFGFLIRIMDALVFAKIRRIGEGLLTLVTYVVAFICVRSYVNLQIEFITIRIQFKTINH